MRQLVKEAKLPAVKFDYGGNFFTVTFRRKSIHSNAGHGNGRTSRLSRLLDSIDDGTFQKSLFAASEGVSQRAIERDLKHLREQGMIVFTGSTKNGRYLVAKKFPKK
ncbi:MAG: hypothetical protein OYH77_02550 [Pseudomonadota bacterium]|nr:hypothetical protein [Pseudomonadota bacterium]